MAEPPDCVYAARALASGSKSETGIASMQAARFGAAYCSMPAEPVRRAWARPQPDTTRRERSGLPRFGNYRQRDVASVSPGEGGGCEATWKGRVRPRRVCGDPEKRRTAEMDNCHEVIAFCTFGFASVGADPGGPSDSMSEKS